MITSRDYENKKLKINLPIGNHRPGDTVNIKCDKNGTPLKQKWRSKLRDAKSDNCVEVFPKLKKVTKKREE